MSAEFAATHVFDSEAMRHYLNGELSVLHCHHYSTLFSQLADDAKLLGGTSLLVEATEESFYPVLSKYFETNRIDSVDDRINIAEQYFSFVGLGNVKINLNGGDGTAEMPHSHVDEGWLSKWSKRDKPVNYIGQGFLAAAFSAINGEEPGTYSVSETQSIVSGAESSKFVITKK